RARLRTAQARLRRRPVDRSFRSKRNAGDFSGVFVWCYARRRHRRENMKRREALVGSVAALAAATSARAADIAVDLQLVLAVDVSRSIDEVEAELQRRGYIEAMTNDRVIDAILSGDNKRIAVCYTEWAGTHYQMVVIDWTLIDSARTAHGFAEK